LGTPVVAAINDGRADAIWDGIGWDFGGGNRSKVAGTKALIPNFVD